MEKLIEKILVVEDSPEVQNNVIQLLKMKGYQAIGADNGLAGLNIAKKELPDLILSDIMMPVLDGYGMFEELQKDSATSLIPFIFLTAKADTRDIRKGMIFGVDDYITKPFKAKELIDVVETRLKVKKKTEKALEQIYRNISTYIPHELRTPLVAILGFSDLILNDIEKLSKDQFKEMVGRIKFAGNRLYETIEKFILYSEVEILKSNKKNNEDLLEFITNSAKYVIEYVLKSGLKEGTRSGDIKLDLADSPINILEEHFEIIIKELLDNALKFSRQGEEINISSRIEESEFIIEIKDYGRGMTVEEIKNIKPFMQHKRSIYEQNGNGLGLIIVKNLIDFYKADMIIESEENEFTSIKLIFPLVNVWKNLAVV